jgi:predicted CXXCH cytochrome family protein
MGPRAIRRAAAVSALCLGVACGEESPSTSPSAEPLPGAVAPDAPGAPVDVGSAVCGECHPEQFERWHGSDHDLAMQVPGPDSVLGDFEDAEYTHFGSTTRFRRGDGRWLVETEGADGKPAEFEVAYTFGVDPLQQYLIAFPDGRLQALSVAWDARPAAEGGQRWFHLYPDEPIGHDDPLHWTRPAHNWNGNCAECHSTRVRKHYDPDTDRFATTWDALDVSCEACHGPGSRHAELARAGGLEGAEFAGLVVSLSEAGTWERAPDAPIAQRVPARVGHMEVETCARCHSRRALLSEDYVYGAPLLDTHRLALLEEGLYFADGQIQDEVYVYGSFLQSRMFAAGVTCSDCHDPHSLALRAEGDALCGRCHSPARYAVESHHHHPTDSDGARCVACHMPSRTYMVIDPRRDHGFRVPRPDLSVELGTPNACNGCHGDRGSAWAAEQVTAWRGDRSAPAAHFARAFDAGRRALPGAEAALCEVARDMQQPAIVRATAIRLLAPEPGSRPIVRAALGDPDPLVRLAAVETSQALDLAQQIEWLVPLLGDPVRAVRIEAAKALAGVPPERLPPRDRRRLEKGVAEYTRVQLTSADRPEANVNLGLLHLSRGEIEQARAAYERSTEIEPAFLPAWVNLADLYRMTGRDDLAEGVLWRALEVAPDSPDLLHALGLVRVRQRRLAEALELLRRAAEVAPERARYAYVYGVALHSEGRSAEAVEVLGAAHERHPADRQILLALATISRDRGDARAALGYARKLEALAPGDPQVRGLVAQLEAGQNDGR